MPGNFRWRAAPGSAGRHRLRQNVHHGQDHRSRRAGRRWCWRTTKRWPRSSITSSRTFFPHNAVEYFVSYYDYYQPEAYIPSGDVYIEKEATINDELDKLRLSATRSLFERRDCVIVASVSCIYGLGSPEAYYGMLLMLEKGQKISRKEIVSEAGGDSVRTQRSRFPARHFPRARRRDRAFSRPMTITLIGSNCGATKLNRSARSIRCSGRCGRPICGCPSIRRLTT